MTLSIRKNGDFQNANKISITVNFLRKLFVSFRYLNMVVWLGNTHNSKSFKSNQNTFYIAALTPPFNALKYN